jgi:hypothetical protein
MVTSNLNNPISNKPAEYFNISTMARYTGETQFYPIDNVVQVPNYRATVAALDRATMTVVSVAGDNAETYRPD